MDIEEFRIRGKEIIDFICEFRKNIESYRVRPLVEPGYLRNLIPKKAPEEPEEWDDIMYDFKQKIMMGITHWQHPKFYAYFPAGCSFPSLLAGLLCDSLGIIGFSWDSSPACTELETIVMDWFGDAIGLPGEFLWFPSSGKGGGVLEHSASDCIFLAMMSARNEAIKYLKTKEPQKEDSAFLLQLVAYCSQESHSCVEKAAKILLIKIRILETEDDGSLKGEKLKQQMVADKAEGLFPFFVSAVLGSTSACAFDNLEELGPVCKEEERCWLHADAAYAGSGFICPELRYLLKGIEFVDSFNTNPNKWLLVNYDCSCFWIKNKNRLLDALIINPLYLHHAKDDIAIDYRHWGIPLSRRFRSLKLWFVIRKYGLSGLRDYIRNHIQLAKYFEELVRRKKRFEIMNIVRLGLVCFRLVAPDNLNSKLIERINSSGKLHLTPATIKDKFVIRFCVDSEYAKKEDIDYAWRIIQEYSLSEGQKSTCGCGC